MWKKDSDEVGDKVLPFSLKNAGTFMYHIYDTDGCKETYQDGCDWT